MTEAVGNESAPRARRLKWPALSGAIVLEVTATLSLRAAVDNPAWLLPVVAGYVGSFWCLALVLRAGVPIGVAYGIWAALGVSLTAILATVIFGDPMTWLIALGIVVVIAGVLLVELGSHAAQRRAPGFAARTDSARTGSGQ